VRETLTFDDIALIPNYCPFESRKDERIDTSTKIGNYKFSIPVISSPMDTITGPEMARRIAELGGLGILHRFMSVEDNEKEFRNAIVGSTRSPTTGALIEPIINVGVSVGVNEGLGRVSVLYKQGARIFCVDVAHGHSKLAGQMVKNLRTEYGKEITIIAGSVCTYAGCDYLVGCGADAIRVGIGTGSACLTKIKTGMGLPQFTTILDCARCSKPIIADGGIRTSGDVVKSFVAGASMVMLGGMLAGTDETPGETFETDWDWNEQLYVKVRKSHKSFRGMASKEANEDNFGALADWKTAEGISTTVSCKGPVEDVIKDIMGGLRSAMTYAGAYTIDEMRRRTEIVRVTQASIVESGAHINDLL